MSVDMYVSSSQSQASSVAAICRQQKQGYEQLQRAINDFVIGSPQLQGAAYDSAKQFFNAVLIPLSKGGILLSEAVMEACQKFPEEYTAAVDSGDLRESDLREKIDQLNRQMSELSDLNDRLQSMLFRQQQDGALDGAIASRMSGAHSLMATYGRAKQKLQEKLDKLLEFNGRSPDIFAEIDGLKESVKTGTSIANGSWNSSVGTFTMPKKADMAWVNEINEAQTKRDLAKFKGCELVYHPGTSEVAPYYSVSKVGNSAEENARLTSLYHQMVKDGKLNLGMLRGMKIGDIPAEEMLVKKTDDLNTVYQKYILCASKGIHPHTGEKLTAAEKNKFLYAGMVTPAMDAFGQVFSARMVKKMSDQLESDSVKVEGDKNVSEVDVPKPKVGAAQSRINIANGPTRFSSSDNAGFNHVVDRHFNPNRNAGQFTIGQDKLKSILSNKNTVNIPVKEIPGNQFERIVDIGEIAGTVKPSLPNVGGQSTNYIRIITDKAGNLVTTYPIPKP